LSVYPNSQPDFTRFRNASAVSDAPHSKNAGRFGTSCRARPIQLFEGSRPSGGSVRDADTHEGLVHAVRRRAELGHSVINPCDRSVRTDRLAGSFLGHVLAVVVQVPVIRASRGVIEETGYGAVTISAIRACRLLHPTVVLKRTSPIHEPKLMR